VREREGACTRREAKGGEGRGAAALVYQLRRGEEKEGGRRQTGREGREWGGGGGASGVGGGGWVIKIIMKVDLVAE
jgi:hypothetical protein